MDNQFLAQTVLFRGSTPEQVNEMMKCFYAREKHFQKGEIILYMGDLVKDLGIVLSGSVTIERDDLLGNRSIFGHAGAGQIFAETYACVPGEPLMVNVVADQDSDILFLDIGRVLTTCQTTCSHHSQLIRNLLMASARKNLGLSERIMHTSPKSIRGRLVSYFSAQAAREGSRNFSIPFNRQQLADYLEVDRSALSAELSKMKKEGLLDFWKNQFALKTDTDEPSPNQKK